MNIDVQGPRRMIQLLDADGNIRFAISESVVTGWLVILAVLAVCLILTHNMQKVPAGKKQCAAEYIVNFCNKMVRSNMGEDCMNYAPYIGALFSYILLGTLISMLGFRSITADISVTGTLAVVTFVLITYNKIHSHGIGAYLKTMINPLNIISEVATPVAMALRLFGNVAGGMIITVILYAALGSASAAVYNLIGIHAETYYFNIFQIAIPAVLSVYFDLFSGTIQSYVFIMLTMIYIQMGRE